MSDLGPAAARNNAAWCDAMCGAHGSPGAVFASHWRTLGAAPRLHPNLVTLDASRDAALAGVREIERARPSPSWAVKDSFAVLPLEPLGFRVLFEAEWIARPPTSGRNDAATRWVRVDSAPMLAAWEAAWGEGDAGSRLFLPSLLSRRDVAILAALGDGAIEAGGIASLGGSVVGLTNFFALGDREAHRAQCVAAASEQFPDLPIVGYESGHDLAACLALGFEALGPLRVWVRA